MGGNLHKFTGRKPTKAKGKTKIRKFRLYQKLYIIKKTVKGGNKDINQPKLAK